MTKRKISEVASRAKGEKFLKSIGYVDGETPTQERTLGESGDYAWGSRVYLHRVAGGYNSVGVALDTATVSKIRRSCWMVAYNEL